ncbi:hypothetical protein ADN00_12820 [Ornatilinea apprima]|uniref:Uncharacterized protein n=1 Tax=Ornatilinea apprima TaxID=1134406 RepID=A0A0P6XKH1_9CHLR|nr:hypothetical protein ADN00_12820 [Ornatilinea apprima]
MFPFVQSHFIQFAALCFSCTNLAGGFVRKFPSIKDPIEHIANQILFERSGNRYARMTLLAHLDGKAIWKGQLVGI